MDKLFQANERSQNIPTQEIYLSREYEQIVSRFIDVYLCSKTDISSSLIIWYLNYYSPSPLYLIQSPRTFPEALNEHRSHPLSKYFRSRLTRVGGLLASYWPVRDPETQSKSRSTGPKQSLLCAFTGQ